MGEWDLDGSTARAWTDFRSRLADHVAAMEDDDLLLVEAESGVDEDDEGAAPYVQFCAWGEDRVRCELAGNAYLDERHVLGPEQVAALADLGWRLPTRGPEDPADAGSVNFHVDAGRNEADRLASMVTCALRDVVGVAHPAFLSSDDVPTRPSLASGGAHAGDDARNDAGDGSGGDGGEEPLATDPDDHDHLQALVDEALVPVVGGPPEHDADGDVPVVHGSALVWVRVLDDVPVVQLFSGVVHDVTDRERAAFEVAVLNRDVRFLKFLLVEDAVMAYLYLPALPFAPMHLRAMLNLMGKTLDRVAGDLATRVGGHPGAGPAGSDRSADAEEAAHPAMRTLLELDAGSVDSVDPELAASICEMDRGLVLRLIRWSTGEQTAWRLTRDEAISDDDPDDIAEICETELRRAERMTDLLRRALRVVAEREAGRTSDRSGRQVPRPRGSRARDEVLPGLDGREPGLFDQ